MCRNGQPDQSRKSYETGSDGAAGRPPGAVFLKNLVLKSFLASGVVRMGVGFIWFLFWAKQLILEPIRTIFDVLGPDRNFGQPGLDLGFLLLRQDR